MILRWRFKRWGQRHKTSLCGASRKELMEFKSPRKSTTCHEGTSQLSDSTSASPHSFLPFDLIFFPFLERHQAVTIHGEGKNVGFLNWCAPLWRMSRRSDNNEHQSQLEQLKQTLGAIWARRHRGLQLSVHSSTRVFVWQTAAHQQQAAVWIYTENHFYWQSDFICHPFSFLYSFMYQIYGIKKTLTIIVSFKQLEHFGELLNWLKWEQFSA